MHGNKLITKNQKYNTLLIFSSYSMTNMVMCGMVIFTLKASLV